MLTYHCDGKPFYGEDNIAAPAKTKGGIEKRIVNEIVAKDHKWNFVLDAYAGFGFSTLIYSRHAKKVVALEKKKKHFCELEDNIVYKTENVFPSRVDNIIYLKRDLREKIDRPILIDLDPRNECEEQLTETLKWMKKGVVLITNGHIRSIRRRFANTRKRYPRMKNKYIGREVILWPREVYLPWLLKKHKRLRIVHFYVHPTSVRVVCVVGRFKLKKKTIKALRARSHYIGWKQSSLSIYRRKYGDNE